ncbi:helix-turn-helix domain-containing protein [Burkholderia cepacia]|uniref:Helix-turn-helix domain-containing protein n=1 Tax=Burkholderia cepacia TaxID=292 RepID=A0A2S8HWW7_BURCE|nr:helix-turn-helix domain-containing protein [Burkholderia cepacia]PQP06939.1 helix-turn-helix domain-containing protein [Burkholderia cepacia]HDR9512176.1 helix-turn-helix domain-containing protein [Burkholderia cepacia]
MSLDATTWARHQKVGKGPAKAVLMALADYANENFVTYPSVETLVAWTEQDRKTVLANLDRLKEGGWITDTGERAGRTRQVVVYVINVARGVEVKIGPRELSTGPRELSTDPNSEQFQNRNSSENGTVPNSTRNSPNFDGKQSQISPETVPNLGHRTVGTIENSRNSSGARGTRLPDDWALTKALGDWALAEQPTWTVEHVRKVAAKFADHWRAQPGQKGRKTDWAATWRNWVRMERPLSGTSIAGGKQEALEAKNQAVARRWASGGGA